MSLEIDMIKTAFETVFADHFLSASAADAFGRFVPVYDSTFAVGDVDSGPGNVQDLLQL